MKLRTDEARTQDAEYVRELETEKAIIELTPKYTAQGLSEPLAKLAAEAEVNKDPVLFQRAFDAHRRIELNRLEQEHKRSALLTHGKDTTQAGNDTGITQPEEDAFLVGFWGSDAEKAAYRRRHSLDNTAEPLDVSPEFDEAFLRGFWSKPTPF